MPIHQWFRSLTSKLCLVQIFASAIPLLAPGCKVVITLKHFVGPLRVWDAAKAQARAEIAALCNMALAGVSLTHLMANGVAEATIVAEFNPALPVASAGAGAALLV